MASSVLVPGCTQIVAPSSCFVQTVARRRIAAGVRLGAGVEFVSPASCP